MSQNLENINQEVLEKPPALYHGSSDKEISEFEPRATVFNHIQKGEYVIATPDYKSSLPYLFSGEIDGQRIHWSAGSYDGQQRVILPVTKEDFLRNDFGGAIYTLSPESFNSVKERANYEWFSKEKVFPVKKEEFNSIMDIWEKNDVHPYFLTKDQFEEFLTLNSGKEKSEFLNSIK